MASCGALQIVIANEGLFEALHVMQMFLQEMEEIEEQEYQEAKDIREGENLGEVDDIYRP